MSFQIRNKEGQALFINDLDREACALWDKAYDEKQYVTPWKPDPEKSDLENTISEVSGNWFDVIGHCIHSPQVDHWGKGWIPVKMSMSLRHVNFALYDYFSKKAEMSETLDKIKFSLEYLKPYFDLIDHWEAKGYTPHKTKD
jgi:hypothetical protein